MDLIQINEVASLLSKVQNEVKVLKSNFNSFGKYKYRSVEDIQVAVKPILLKYEATIVLSDEVIEICGIPMINSTARFICSYGELSVSAQAGVDVHKKGMDIAQTFGSSGSYARKYALSGLLLLDDVQDADATNKHEDKKEDKKVALLALADDQVDLAISQGKAKGVVDNIGKRYSVTPEQEARLKASL